MTFEEQYSLVMNQFFKENLENKERLREMIYSIYNPIPGSILDVMVNNEFTAGDCKYRTLKIKGEWIIQIRDKSDKQVGEIEFKDQFLVYCDDITKRMIAIEHQNGIITDINLFQILLDNF